MELHEAIEIAANLAFDEDADQIVGLINGSWEIAHTDDLGRQSKMTEPRFTVNAYGVDPGHIERGEISENWELP